MCPTLRVIAFMTSAAFCGCASMRVEVAVDGERSAAIGEVLDVHSAALEACYARALAMNDGVNGRIVLRALIMQDGRPHVPAARVSDAQLVPVATCMLQQLSRWRFPPSTEAGYVSIPLILKTVRTRRPSVKNGDSYHFPFDDSVALLGKW
ncbi:MAG: AgmX/PglI C-terminal domain-containing protein [Myxococcota bacterium]